MVTEGTPQVRERRGDRDVGWTPVVGGCLGPFEDGRSDVPRLRSTGRVREDSGGTAFLPRGSYEDGVNVLTVGFTLWFQDRGGGGLVEGRQGGWTP